MHPATDQLQTLDELGHSSSSQIHAPDFLPNYFTTIQDNNNIPSDYYNQHFNNEMNSTDFTAAEISCLFPNFITPYNHQYHHPITQTTSGNSTSDDADDQFITYNNNNDDSIRKRRRMISNRESARRSRMRKQKYVDELWSLVTRLRVENRDLTEKLSSATESHDTVVLENIRLKEEATSLRIVMDINSGCLHKDDDSSSSSAFSDEKESMMMVAAAEVRPRGSYGESDKWLDGMEASGFKLET